MKKQILYTAAVIGGFIILLGGVKACQIAVAISQHSSFKPPPDTIATIITKEESWSHTLLAIGSLQAVQGATLSAEEEGKITKISFESGSQVEQGKSLLEIDTTTEEAKLKGALAKLDETKNNLGRSKKMKQTELMAASVFDSAESDYRAAEAEVESLQATIARKRVIAPFAGNAGIRTVNVGDYVSKGTPLVPLYSLSPLFINFSLPQQSVTNIAVGQEVLFKVDSLEGKTFSGKITAINPQIDPITRNINVQATLQNDEKLLKPGMFGEVKVTLSEKFNVIPLPATAIKYAPYGDTVFVIEKMKDEKGEEYLGAREQVVTLGPSLGDQVSILSGLKANQEVAMVGVFKLRPMAPVVVNNSTLPANEKNPNPADT